MFQVLFRPARGPGCFLGPLFSSLLPFTKPVFCLILVWVPCRFLLLILHPGGAGIQEVRAGVRVTQLWNLIGSGGAGQGVCALPCLYSGKGLSSPGGVDTIVMKRQF